MNRFLFLLINFCFIAVSSLNIFAQNSSLFVAREYISQTNDTLRYRFLEPRADLKYNFQKSLKKNLLINPKTADTLYPLLVFLHGSGERGYDNTVQINHIKNIVTDSAFMAAYPCYIIAPQCAPKRKWVEVDWSALQHTMPSEPSVSERMLMNLVDSVIKSYPVDTCRLYITGLSMGGFGTWDIISRYPGKFAAAIPVCGGADLAQAAKLINTPIWVFHGIDDKAVKVSRSRNMVDAIKKAGGKPVYTEYPVGTGHNAWTPTYANPKVWEWLFGQKKQ